MNGSHQKPPADGSWFVRDGLYVHPDRGEMCARGDCPQGRRERSKYCSDPCRNMVSGRRAAARRKRAGAP